MIVYLIIVTVGWVRFIVERVGGGLCAISLVTLICFVQRV